MSGYCFKFTLTGLACCLFLNWGGWAWAGDPLDGKTGRIEIDGKPYRYALASELVSDPVKPDASFCSIVPKGPAPATVHVNALDIKLTSGNCLSARYEWDFGDPGARFNQLVGWNAAHCYSKPGKYTIVLTITEENGQSRTLKNQVTINPDNRRKILVSQNDGIDTDNGSDEKRPVQTLDRALELIGSDTELLLERGGTYEINKQINLPYVNLRIGAWGQGERPKLRWIGPRSGAYFFSMDAGKSRDVVIEEMSFDTPFDTDTEQKDVPSAVKPAGSNITVRNCEFQNVAYALNGLSKPTGVLVQENIAPLPTGLRAYLVWMESSDFVIIGNSVANSTREHCLRSSAEETTRVLVAYNDLTNLDRTSVDAGDQYKTTINIRAGNYIYLTNNTLKDGSVSFGPSTNMAAGAQARWIVVDSNRIVNAQLKIGANTRHVLARNNLLDLAGIEQVSIVPTEPNIAERYIEDIRFVNNTSRIEGRKGKFLKIYGKARAGSIDWINNLMVAPKLKPGEFWAAGMDVKAPDLSGFRLITGNVWPATEGAIHLIGEGLDNRNYKTVEQWKALAPVRGDVFEIVSVDDKVVPTTNTRAVVDPSARWDMNGKPRVDGSCVPGAVQP